MKETPVGRGLFHAPKAMGRVMRPGFGSKKLEQFHIWCIGDRWSTPSGVHNCRQFWIAL